MKVILLTESLLIEAASLLGDVNWGVINCHVNLCGRKMEGKAGIILWMRTANERRRYIVTSSLTGWTHSQNDPWIGLKFGSVWKCYLNTLRLSKNGHNFVDSIFKFLFFYENWCILIPSYLNFFLKGSIDCKPALVQIMAWCRTGIFWTSYGLVYWHIYVSHNFDE